MFGFRKKDRITTVAEFFKNQKTVMPGRETSVSSRRRLPLKSLIVPVIALLFILALAIHVEGLRSETAGLKKENAQKTAEIGALKAQAGTLAAERAKFVGDLEAAKSDVARLEKELETEKFLRAKEAQAAARKPAPEQKKVPKRKG